CLCVFFFSSRRRHTRFSRDWSSDVCSSDLGLGDRWAYWDAINDVYHGLDRDAVRRLYRESDALINLCGATRLREEHLACPVRIRSEERRVGKERRARWSPCRAWRRVRKDAG